MGTDRFLRTKTRRRPKKQLKERKRRIKRHHKRLAVLGYSTADLKNMDAKQIRTVLRAKPKRAAKMAASEAASKA